MWNELNPGKHDPNEVGRWPREEGEVGRASETDPSSNACPGSEPTEIENGPAPFTEDVALGEESTSAKWENADADALTDSQEETADAPSPGAVPRLAGRRHRGRQLVKPENAKLPTFTPAQRLLILDCWQRSGLPAKDFGNLVGVSKHTLYAWRKAFSQHGPAGLMDQPRGVKQGSRLPELTKRTILMLKEQHPDWGCERISGMLLRGPALPASPSAVARVLHEAGYQLQETPTRPHAEQVRSFERARPNQLWQTDLFTFMLKRQNRRVYLVAFLDDQSRFLVSFGLHASQSTALVLEVFRSGVAAYGTPDEVLTDNGSQYVTWRGASAFHKELTQRGVRHIVSHPRHPQTLGKIERFWGTLWRECLETAVFVDLADARARIGHFIDHYNFQRVHSGIDGLVPADRFFGAAPEVLRTLKQRVAGNALELARDGIPKAPFYLTGQVGGKNFSLHAEGERVFLTREGDRQEIDLVPPTAEAAAAVLPPAVCPDGSPAGMGGSATTTTENCREPAPGTSPLDEWLVARGDAKGAPAAGLAANDLGATQNGGTP